jgi:hypothetical protein
MLSLYQKGKKSAIIMILIAHRGNINGSNPRKENSPDYIREALEKGYDAEIDVWYRDDKWILGHDESLYNVDISFLRHPKLWCHAKNIPALEQMLDAKIHCFYHDKDATVLTSRKFMWTYPGNQLTKKSICVMPEWPENKHVNFQNAAGICTDNILKYAIKYT